MVMNTRKWNGGCRKKISRCLITMREQVILSKGFLEGTDGKIVHFRKHFGLMRLNRRKKRHRQGFWPLTFAIQGKQTIWHKRYKVPQESSKCISGSLSLKVVKMKRKRERVRERINLREMLAMRDVIKNLVKKSIYAYLTLYSNILTDI